MDVAVTLNADYIDAQYQRWKADPESVPSDWQIFFKGFEIGLAGQAPAAGGISEDQARRQAAVESLIRRYRSLGHLLACMDPLSACPTDHPLLNLAAFGLGPQDLELSFPVAPPLGSGLLPLKEIIARLRETYCRSIGVEFMHLQDPDECLWLLTRMETTLNRPQLEVSEKVRILEKLIASSLFEGFLNKKFVGVTRFSLEGGDGVIPLLDTLVEHLAASGTREIIMGMAHRGRLNVQANILHKPLAEIFAEFESCYDPDQVQGSGDVKYHNGYLADTLTEGGRPLLLFLVSNPSHLEAVDPVVEGITRARRDLRGAQGPKEVAAMLIHGDAAFAGQGIVAETLNMSQLKGYATGGTLHLVINNQIGYTTLPEHARSTRYSTDVAKMLMVPIFHVHGENPEAIVHVARMAADYRNTFGKDVVIDIVCYRRYGHNEGDEPYFTQPLMYDRIHDRPALSMLYRNRLIEEKIVTPEQVAEIEKRFDQALNAAYDEIHGSDCPFPQAHFFEDWQGYQQGYTHDPVTTALAPERLLSLARQLNRPPDDFHLHPKLKGLFARRLQAVEKGAGIDWGNAEALAFASLLTEGTPIRLSGQDVGRGTFSQRHSVLIDRETGAEYIPLNSLAKDQAPFMIYDSLLAEAGVLGFEYGYSQARPDVLILWEAQFGDFSNNAQAIIDLFIAAGQVKWQRQSGLTLLLPHGWEGLGPEHSSARLERFLQLCADDNLQVCNLSTPAQYFHALRRQIKSSFRKPLVIMTPKSLLRHPLAVSTLADLSQGAYQAVLDDAHKPKTPRKVLVCSGKVYYQLVQRRQEIGANDLAIVRLEQFYPFPQAQLEKIIKKYAKTDSWVWVQEEPANMGAWQFVRPRLEGLLGRPLAYVGRQEAASPATGFPKIYRKQQADISDAAVGPFHEAQGISG
jgi:2-oxoglutarate dehydrogenase E1 component